MTDRRPPPLRRFLRPFAWEEVEPRSYKEDDGSYFRVTRQVLFDGEHGPSCQLRYFEIGPRGHTTLERHQHAHAVVVMRGSGRVLVEPQVFDVRPFDLISVPPLTWHQLRAAEDESLGFLCLVDLQRDRPERPDEQALARLRRDTAISAFIRV